MRETLDDAYFVILCDWRGCCTWASAANYSVKVGDFLWEHLAPKSQEHTKTLLGRAVTSREAQVFEVFDVNGDRFRGRLWPLDSPDVAVCMLAIRIPRELALLTQRERDCLNLLAKGIETRLIAEQLEVSVSTVQTHFKRAREAWSVHLGNAGERCRQVLLPA